MTVRDDARLAAGSPRHLGRRGPAQCVQCVQWGPIRFVVRRGEGIYPQDVPIRRGRRTSENSLSHP
eukprot:8236587-Pyramimonas_sp.AAC.1